ncbi:MAG: TatD family hydrolase [Magnetococcales bacterium]|nr:TatD family hydrolase [Magnetococcales bacterium]
MTIHDNAIDTHAHLCDDRFDPDRSETIRRAFAGGVSAIFLVGETIDDAHFNLALSREQPGLYALAGLYPAHADLESSARMVDFIKTHHQHLIGIGEVGLDFMLATSEPERSIQQIVLKQFVDISMDLDLPLNVHSRSAAKETVALLLETGAKRVQLHAYHGKHSVALQGIEAGYFFSVPTSIVRSQQMRDLFHILPLSQLMLESDSPVLGPVAGERNEPLNILQSIPVLAQIKNLSIRETADQLFQNSLRFYSLEDLP